MTSNEISLILQQIATSTSSLATREQVMEIDTKLDHHLDDHKVSTTAWAKVGFIFLGSIVGVVVPLAINLMVGS